MPDEHLELIAATAWFWTFATGFIISTIASLYVLTHAYWLVLVLYAGWIYYDRQTCERGGRSVHSVRQWTWWRHVKNYFNFKLVTADGFHLDADKNYIFGCFPHGIQPVGTFLSFVADYERWAPRHTPYTTALNIQFWMPVVRELFLSTGAVSVSAPSIKHLLDNPRGGNIVSILVGGGDESQYSRPGQYKIILKKRKGFVKLALQKGAPLVPVITFGEPDVFDQLSFPGFELVRDLVKKLTQVVLVVPLGRYLVCPNRVPITTVVGRPIDVVKNDSPTNEEIDDLHQKFVEQLRQLFDDHKDKYLKEPANTFLEIV